MKKDFTLSDFCNMQIKRTDVAEIIVDYSEGDINKSVRLIGFSTDINKTDFEIQEEGFEYYQNLKEEINKNRK